VMFYLVQRRLELKEVVAGSGEGGLEGLRQEWEERKIGVGGRVRGLVVERLRMNARDGIVGRWQEVCLYASSLTSTSLYLHEYQAFLSRQAY
jgi:hypothetical protein